MSRLFGTDGIRGVANREPLTPVTLARIGAALGKVLRDRGGRLAALVGRDPRRSGAMVGSAIVSGLLSAGVDVTTAAVLPTPAVARLARSERFGMGVVISASHNPAEDNGVKVFLGNGRKAGEAFEAAVERKLETTDDAPSETPGAYHADPDAGERYLDSLLKEFRDLDLSSLRIALDAAHGAMATLAPRAFLRLGATVQSIGVKPDGNNINRGVGATHPDRVAREVRRAGADLGVCFDGDGDRALFSDASGRVLDGDAVLAILARDFLARRILPHRTVVATVMSNVGLERSLAAINCRLVRTDVGDKSVVAAMEKGGYRLGGEQSGHFIIARRGRRIGDGLESALHLIRAVLRSGQPLAELASCFVRSPQCLLNVRVSDKPDLMKVRPIAKEIARVEKELGDAGRVLVRYSGTESLARVMVEGPSLDATRDAAEHIAQSIDQEIGSAQ